MNKKNIVLLGYLGYLFERTTQRKPTNNRHVSISQPAKEPIKEGKAMTRRENGHSADAEKLKLKVRNYMHNFRQFAPTETYCLENALNLFGVDSIESFRAFLKNLFPRSKNIENWIQMIQMTSAEAEEEKGSCAGDFNSPEFNSEIKKACEFSPEELREKVANLTEEIQCLSGSISSVTKRRKDIECRMQNCRKSIDELYDKQRILNQQISNLEAETIQIGDELVENGEEFELLKQKIREKNYLLGIMTRTLELAESKRVSLDVEIEGATCIQFVDSKELRLFKITFCGEQIDNENFEQACSASSGASLNKAIFILWKSKQLEAENPPGRKIVWSFKKKDEVTAILETVDSGVVVEIKE